MANMANVVKDKKVLDLVLGNKGDSEIYLRSSNYYTEWKTWHDMWRSIPDSKPYEWMSNKFIPVTFSKIETAVASYMQMLFAANPPIQVRPVEKSDVEQARIMEKLLGVQYERASVYEAYTSFVRNILIYGTGIAKVMWCATEENNIVWQPQYKQYYNPQGKLIGQDYMGSVPQQSRSDYRMPVMINCAIEDIFPDPQAIGIQDSWLIQRTRRTLNYLRRMHELYPNDYNENVLKIQESDTGDKQFEAREDLYSSLGRLTTAGVSRPKNTGHVELYERWGLYDLGRKDESVGISLPNSNARYKSVGLESCQLTVAAGKYVIQARPNPYWHKRNPFIKGVYVPTPNQFYGIGVSEILEDIQNNINEIVNQRNDNISLALNTPFEYDRTAGVDLANLMMKPGGLYGASGAVGTALKPIILEFYTKDAFAHVSDMERWAQEATAITPTTQGVNESSSQTATEASLKARGTASRMALYAKLNEKMAFSELARMFYQLTYQYMTEEEVIQVVGESAIEWIKVSPETVRKDYNFIPAGVFTMESKQQTALRLIQFLNIAGDDPIFKKSEAYKKIYYALELGDNPEELLRDDAEIQEIQKIAMEMANSMMNRALDKTDPGKSGGKDTFVADESVPTPGVPPPNPNQ